MDDSFAIKRRPQYMKIIVASLTVLTLGFGGGAVIASQMDDGTNDNGGKTAQTTSKTSRANLASQTGMQFSADASESGVMAGGSGSNETSAGSNSGTVASAHTTKTQTSTSSPTASSNGGSTPSQSQPTPTPTQQNPTGPTDNSAITDTGDADAALRACVGTGGILSPLLALEVCTGAGLGLSL